MKCKTLPVSLVTQTFISCMMKGYLSQCKASVQPICNYFVAFLLNTKVKSVFKPHSQRISCTGSLLQVFDFQHVSYWTGCWQHRNPQSTQPNPHPTAWRQYRDTDSSLVDFSVSFLMYLRIVVLCVDCWIGPYIPCLVFPSHVNCQLVATFLSMDTYVL